MAGAIGPHLTNASVTIAIALGAAAILFRRQVVVKVYTGMHSGVPLRTPCDAAFDIRGSVENQSAQRVT